MCFMTAALESGPVGCSKLHHSEMVHFRVQCPVYVYQQSCVDNRLVQTTPGVGSGTFDAHAVVFFFVAQKRGGVRVSDGGGRVCA